MVFQEHQEGSRPLKLPQCTGSGSGTLSMRLLWILRLGFMFLGSLGCQCGLDPSAGHSKSSSSVATAFPAPWMLCTHFLLLYTPGILHGILKSSGLCLPFRFFAIKQMWLKHYSNSCYFKATALFVFVTHTVTTCVPVRFYTGVTKAWKLFLHSSLTWISFHTHSFTDLLKLHYYPSWQMVNQFDHP